MRWFSLFPFSQSPTATQWNLSNQDINGAEESAIVSEVSSFQRLQEWYLGWEKVSSVQRERGSTVSLSMYVYIHTHLFGDGVRV